MNTGIDKHKALTDKHKYQSIFESIPIGILYFDTKGVITDNNDYASHIFGRTKEEFLGLNLLTQLKDQKLLQAMRDVLASGEGSYCDYYQPLNGHLASYLQITLQAIYNEAGIITAAVGLIKNITKEKEAEKSLNHYKQMLDATTDMMAFINNQYRYIATNKAYSNFHQRAGGSISGKKVLDIIGEENFSPIKILIDRALGGEGFTVKGTYQHPRTEDTIYDVIYEEASFAPYISDDGEITGVVIAIRDITDQEIIKKKAHREAKRTQYYLDIVPVMILALDNGANIIRINQKGCEVLGYTKKELLGKNWIDTCIPEKIQDEIHLVFSKVIEKDIDYPQAHTNSIITKSGEERTITWKNILIKDDDDNIIEILSSGEDITK